MGWPRCIINVDMTELMWLYIIQIRGGNDLKLLSCLAECENQCVKLVLLLMTMHMGAYNLSEG